jgi:metallophosphoesterase (TIGR00282 family)
MIRVLFIGDVVGHLGRATVGKILPNLKKQRKIDLCIANGENLAGGRGLTSEAVNEVIRYGVDLFTGGDHTFWKRDFVDEISKLPVLKCINLKKEYPGYGFVETQILGAKILVISVLGTASSFIREEAENPFSYMDAFLKEHKEKENNKVILVDFHAEASSEKVALGWFLDGRVTAVCGTHTHIPSCDFRVLPNGTAYITDLGMVGSSEGVIGVKRDIIIDRFLKNDLRPFEWVRSGRAVFNSVLIEINEWTGEAQSIERIDEVIEA